MKIKIKKNRNVGWTVSNLCRGDPEPPLSEVVIFLPYLNMILETIEESEIIWGFFFIINY